MPNWKMEIIIEKVSESDMDYIISQLKDAVDLCQGKVIYRYDEWKENDEQ